MTRKHSLGLTLATLGALGLSSVAQQAYATVTLVDQYNFNGNANDSVGSANATPGSNTTFVTVGSNEYGVTPGGNGQNTSNYYSFTGTNLTNLINTLKTTTRGSTFEFFLGNTAQETYSPLFAFGSGSGGGDGSSGKYEILSAYRAGNQIGAGASISNGYNNESSATSSTAVANGDTVAYVFGVGTAQIYVNGVSVYTNNNYANTPDVVANALVPADGIVAGIGGGSVFGDPTQNGQFNDVRIYNGALTSQQVLADYNAGANATPLASAAPEPSQVGMMGLMAFGLGGLILRAKKRQTKTTETAA